MTSVYTGRTAVLATMHGKEKAVSGPFLSRLGLRTILPEMFDTDLLGTFTGEIPRCGTMEQAVLAKAHAAMKITGDVLSIASEGSYGPHPQIPFIAAGIEVMVFVDDERSIVIKETLIDETPIFSHKIVGIGEDLSDFLEAIDFPAHGLIVSPNQPSLDARLFYKGIMTADSLASAITMSCVTSKDRQALVQTDMRAHMNPTRMKAIEKLAEKLAKRVASLCPACGSPGYGLVNTKKGLPCEYCGGPSILVSHEILGCLACDYTETKPRSDGKVMAEQQYCNVCNP